MKQEQFEQQLISYFPMLYKTAYRLTENKEDAEDIVQETYAKAFRFSHQFQEGSSLKSWLLKILRNTFYDLTRKQKRQFNIHEEVAQSNSTPYSQEETFHPLDREGGEILKTLSFLPEEYRMVLTLYYVDDCTYAEIADIMECPLGTVRSRLSRGKKFLKNKYTLKQSGRR